MICSTCNATISAGDVFCGSCGARQAAAPPTPSASMALDPQAVERVKEGAQAAARLAQDIGVQVGKSSVLRGFVALILSIFTMPIKTMKTAGRLLREIGRKGSLDQHTELRHLTWFITAMPVLATVALFSILLFGVLGLFGAGLLPNAFGGNSNILLKLGALVGVYLMAVVVDWLIMFSSELLALAVHNYQSLRGQLVVLREQSAHVSAIAAAARDSGRL